MSQGISRRALTRASVLTLGSFAILRHARGDAPIELRCSLDTAPSHPRNVAFRDYLSKIEAASGGQLKTKLFESGSLFPDLQVVKALVQGQVEMACPGTWTITGFVSDADFSQLPAFYGRPIEQVHKAADGEGGKFVNAEINSKLHVQVLGPWFDLGFNNWYSTRKPLNSTSFGEMCASATALSCTFKISAWILSSSACGTSTNLTPCFSNAARPFSWDFAVLAR